MSDASSQSPVFPDDVDVAIVSHNGRATLPRLLQCLAAAGAPPERIVVHDVGSTDDTSAWLARDWPRVTVRRIDGNVGPNPARNRALLEATRPYVLLLDADAYVRPDAAARLRSALDPAKSVGTTVPVVVHSHDPNLIQYAAGSIHFMCEAINPWQNRPLAERGTKLSDIGTAPGVAYLIDVSVAQRIGLFDERYFLGKEDGDFCHRLVMAGYRLVEDPLAIVEHPSKPRSAWLFKWQVRNRWHFLLKNYEVRTLIILLPALAFHEVLQFGMLVLKGHVRAWWDALRNLAAWMPTLRTERRAIQMIRRKRDRDLLQCAPLIVRQDLLKGGGSRLLKRAYDAWLGAYWGVARHLLS